MTRSGRIIFGLAMIALGATVFIALAFASGAWLFAGQQRSGVPRFQGLSLFRASP